MKKRKAALAVGLSLAIGFCSIGLAACGGDNNKGTGGGGGGGGTTVTHKPGDRSEWYAAGKLTAPEYANVGEYKTYKTLAELPEAMSLLYTNTENLYTLTLNLYQGDEFKVLKIGMEWSPKITGDLLDESMTDGYITGGGGVNESDWNFQCNNDGKYTFSFKIGGGKTSVTYTRDANIPALPKPAESITLEQSSVTLELGNPDKETFEIKATVLPEGADNADEIEYESEDEEVATVDDDGVVTAVGVGETTITVSCGDATPAEFTVRVIDANDAVHATDVELNKSETTLKIGHITETLEATPQPANTTDTAVWTSSDPTVVSVADGVITALKPGTATIKVTYGTGDDAVDDECVVTVLDEYFLAGAFKSVENAGNWNSDWKTATSALAFVQDEEDENVYKLTGVTLMNNDEFKVVFTSMPSNWDGCLGFGAVDDDNDYVSEGGGGNIVVEDAGVYTLTITIEDETATLTFEQTEDLEESWEYDVAFRGNWGGGEWTDIKFGNQTFDKEHNTLTADIELDTAAGFGVKTCAPGTFNQAAWYNSSVMECAASVTTITLPQDAGNATCTAAGTYNVTITFNDNGKITKILFNSFTAAPPAAE